jgi:HK97 family phage portal protein
MASFYERARGFVAARDQNRIAETRAVDASDFGLAPGQYQKYGNTAGIQVGTEEVMRAAMGACVRLLADDISTLPWKAYKGDDESRVRIDPPVWMGNPDGTRFGTRNAHITEAVTSLLTDGNLFVEALPHTLRPNTLHVLDPELMDVAEGGLVPSYRARGISGRDFTEAEIMHVVWQSRPGRRRGMSMVEVGRESTGLELAARQWAGKFFENGATLGGVVVLPKEARKPTPQEIAELREQFEGRHKGSAQSWLLGILTGGADIKDASIKPKEAELVPLWDHVLEEAARTYHIPPHMLASQGGHAMGLSDVEQRSIEYVQHAAVPVVSRLEEAYSRLMPRPDEFIRFDVDALLRGDAKKRAETRRIELDSRVITRDEWRSSIDRAPAPDGEGGYLDTPNNRTTDPRINEATALIRAGFEPADTLAVLGLPAIAHKGTAPTTIYNPEPPVESPADAEDSEASEDE